MLTENVCWTASRLGNTVLSLSVLDWVWLECVCNGGLVLSEGSPAQAASGHSNEATRTTTTPLSQLTKGYKFSCSQLPSQLPAAGLSLSCLSTDWGQRPVLYTGTFWTEALRGSDPVRKNNNNSCSHFTSRIPSAESAEHVSPSHVILHNTMERLGGPRSSRPGCCWKWLMLNCYWSRRILSLLLSHVILTDCHYSLIIPPDCHSPWISPSNADISIDRIAVLNWVCWRLQSHFIFVSLLNSLKKRI